MFYQLYKEFSYVFAALNANLFKGALKEPNFDVFPKKRCVVDFCPETMSIFAGGDIVKVDNPTILASFLHAMVHLKNYSDGIVDNRKGYHNGRFLDAALAVGLFATYHLSYGWKPTYLSVPKGVKKIRCPAKEDVEKRKKVFQLLNVSKASIRKVRLRIKEISKRTRTGIYFLKYECECDPPHNSIRSGRRPDGQSPLHIKCLDCGSLFKCVDA